MTTINHKQITAEQLLEMPDMGRCELIAGELRMMTPAGEPHGWVAFRLALLIGNHVLSNGLGRAYAAETGFILARDPDTVRAPDVAFVRKDRLAIGSPGFIPVSPDLAVEVVSRDDRAGEVEEKAQAWMAAGTRMVWVAWPSTRTITVYRPGAKPVTLREGETLDGEDVLPGFQCAVADVFAEE